MPIELPILTASNLLANAIGLPATLTEAQVQHVIDKVTDRLLANACVRSRLESGAITRDLVAGVIEDIVLGAVRNPSAYRQVSVDDGAYMIDTTVASGSAKITDADLAQLGCRPNTGRVGSVQIGIPRWRLP